MEVACKDPTHLCDSWRWLASEGKLCAVGDLQATLTTNGVLLTFTAGVKTPTGVQIVTQCHVAIAQCSPNLLVFAQTAYGTFGELLLQWDPFFRQIYGIRSETRL